MCLRVRFFGTTENEEQEYHARIKAGAEGSGSYKKEISLSARTQHVLDTFLPIVFVRLDVVKKLLILKDNLFLHGI